MLCRWVGTAGAPVARLLPLEPKPTTVDFHYDSADLDRKVACPTLVFYGAAGAMARLFNIPDEWRRRCPRVEEASVPGGHFFVD